MVGIQSDTYVKRVVESSVMAAGKKDLQDAINKLINLLATLGEAPVKANVVISELINEFADTGATTAECNSLMYETVKKRLKAEGQIKDDMSETQADWIIITDEIICRSIKLSFGICEMWQWTWEELNQLVFVKMFEFPRFIPFVIRTNKKSLLAWIELFTKLLDIEKRKERTSGKKKSYEIAKVIETCEGVLDDCDMFICKRSFKKPYFQINLMDNILKSLIDWEFDDNWEEVFKRPCLENFWMKRLWHLKELRYDGHKVDMCRDAWLFMTILQDEKLTTTSKDWRLLRTHCRMPISEEDEKYLVERKRLFDLKCDEESARCEAAAKKRISKPKRGAKARAARVTAARQEAQFEMRYKMKDSLMEVALESERRGGPTPNITFNQLATMVVPETQPERARSFKNEANLNLLIQLVKEGAVLESEEAPIKEMMGMKKDAVLSALRKLRKKVCSTPNFSI